ncbi:MAG: hypothetical protein Kow00120_02430 [Anaerolineae bacterium]
MLSEKDLMVRREQRKAFMEAAARERATREALRAQQNRPQAGARPTAATLPRRALAALGGLMIAYGCRLVNRFDAPSASPTAS